MSGLVTSPLLSDVYGVLQPFLMAVTGLAQDLVIQGLPNRTAMPPASPGFISMQATITRRLRTNVDTGSWIGEVNPNSVSSEQGTLLRVQLDCYGAASGDWAAQISTMFRDDYGCVALAGVDGSGNPLVPPICQPLYIDDGKLAALVDTEDQYEQRWVLEAMIQYNPITTAPLQFANTAKVTVINVDEAYPPT